MTMVRFHLIEFFFFSKSDRIYQKEEFMNPNNQFDCYSLPISINKETFKNECQSFQSNFVNTFNYTFQPESISIRF